MNEPRKMVVRVLMGALFPWPEIGCSRTGSHGPCWVLPMSPVTPTLEEEQGPGFVHHRAFSEAGLGEGWLRSLGVSHSECHSFIHKCSGLPVIFRTWMKQEACPD